MRINLGFIKGLIERDGGWLRIFGRGIGWKNIKKRKMLFSERNGYVTYKMYGSWLVRKLDRDRKVRRTIRSGE